MERFHFKLRSIFWSDPNSTIAEITMIIRKETDADTEAITETGWSGERNCGAVFPIFG